MEPYCRYAYFIKSEELEAVEPKLHSGPGRVYRARRMVCELLHPKRPGGIALPEAWNKNCRRQGSWFRASRHKGEILVVAAEKPEDDRPGVKITPADFRPPRRPTPKEIGELTRLPAYLKVRPPDWEVIDHFDREQFRLFRQGLFKLGLATAEERDENLVEVFPGHCANHANFIEPSFFLEKEGRKVPYSIDTTLRVCSACVELFDLLGSDFSEKLVVLCPGAVVTTGFPRDGYFRVTRF